MKNYKNPSLPKMSFQSLLKNLSSAPKLSFGSSPKLSDLSGTGLQTSTTDPDEQGHFVWEPIFTGEFTNQSASGASSWAGLFGGSSSGILGGLSSGILGGLGVGQLTVERDRIAWGWFEFQDTSRVTALYAAGSQQHCLSFSATFLQPVVRSREHERPGEYSTTARAADTIHAACRTDQALKTEVPAGVTGSSSGSQYVSSGHQVHVHVSALDTQSFMDRSNDIAKAVKSAMLQSSSLNDVISEI